MFVFLYHPLGNNSWNLSGEKKMEVSSCPTPHKFWYGYSLDSLELRCFCFAFFSSWEIILGFFVGRGKWKLF